MTSIAGLYNSDAEPSAGYTPMAAGEYQMEIVESEYVTNQAGTGNVLKTKAQIVGGEYDGRPYYLNYNLENDDPKKQEIGQRDFGALRRATGVLAPDTPQEMHFKVFGVKLGIKNRKGTSEPENVVRQYVLPPIAA